MGPFEIIGGLLFLFFLPGFSLVYLSYLFRDLKRGETVFLSFVLSIAINVLLCLYIDWLGLDIDIQSVFLGTTVFVILCSMCGILRWKFKGVESPTESVRLQEPWKGKVKYYLILTLIFFFGLFLRVYPNFFFQYPVGWNTDTAHHFVLTDILISTQHLLRVVPNYYIGRGPAGILYYPLGFHIITAEISMFFGVSQMRIFQILPAFFGAVTVLSIYFLTVKLGGDQTNSLLASFFIASSFSQLSLVFDGNWPSMIGILYIPVIIYLLYRTTVVGYKYIILSGLAIGGVMCIYGPLSLSVGIPIFVLGLFALVNYKLNRDFSLLLRSIIRYISAYFLGGVLALPWILSSIGKQATDYMLTFGDFGHGFPNDVISMIRKVGVILFLLACVEGIMILYRRNYRKSSYSAFVATWLFSLLGLFAISYAFHSYVWYRLTPYLLLPCSISASFFLKELHSYISGSGSSRISGHNTSKIKIFIASLLKVRLSPKLSSLIICSVLIILVFAPLQSFNGDRESIWGYVNRQAPVLTNSIYSALFWIKENTPENSILMCYGWWNTSAWGRPLLCWAPAISQRGVVWMGHRPDNLDYVFPSLRTYDYNNGMATHLLLDVESLQLSSQAIGLNPVYFKNIYNSSQILIYKVKIGKELPIHVSAENPDSSYKVTFHDWYTSLSSLNSSLTYRIIDIPKSLFGSNITLYIRHYVDNQDRAIYIDIGGHHLTLNKTSSTPGYMISSILVPSNVFSTEENITITNALNEQFCIDWIELDVA